MKVPVYSIKLRRERKPLELAESTVQAPYGAAVVLSELIGLTDREHFAVLFLDCQNAIVGVHVAHIGGQSAVAGVEARTVFRAAIAACASMVVLGHNHPSGDPTPSKQDRATTAQLVEAGKVLGIPVVDHVIVTRDCLRHYSMASHGELES